MFEDPKNFGLPIPGDMLRLGSQEPWQITSGGPDVLTVATKYFVIKIHASGASSQLELDSRPAFEVSMLALVEDKPHVLLIRKERIEQSEYRPNNWVTKLPGGYFHDGSTGNMEFVEERLLQETGIKVDPSSVKFFGTVLGHTEIRTPILLGYATRFTKVQPPRAGVEILDVSLSDALQLAENALSRTEPFLENETGLEGLFAISRMFERGDIALTA